MKSQLIWRFSCGTSDCDSYHFFNSFCSLCGTPSSNSIQIRTCTPTAIATKTVLFLLASAKKVYLQTVVTNSYSSVALEVCLLHLNCYCLNSCTNAVLVTNKSLEKLPLVFLFLQQVSSFYVCVCYDQYLYHHRHWTHPQEEPVGLGLEHLDLDLKTN